MTHDTKAPRVWEDFDPSVQAQNMRGEYVPAVPLPLYRGVLRRFQCSCGERFWTEGGYRGHYAYQHVLGMPW